MINQRVRVYTFPRSGTHWLMSLLYARFYGSQNLASPSRHKTHIFYNWKGPGIDMPWYALLGGHWYHPDNVPWKGRGKQEGLAHTDPSRAVYLYRDGRDVAVSNWKMFVKAFLDDPETADKPGIPFTRFMAEVSHGGAPLNPVASTDRNVVWHWSVRKWLESGMYCVRYEDLVKDLEGTLAKIAVHFDLKPDPLPVQYDTNISIGFRPSAGPRVGKWRKVFSEADLVKWNQGKQIAKTLEL